MDEIGAVGIPWYRREDWDGLLELFADADKMHDSYDDWLETAIETEEHLRSAGLTVERIVIDADEFSGWCALRGLALDADARSGYAAEMNHLKHQGDG